jgi:hypothetical protein
LSSHERSAKQAEDEAASLVCNDQVDIPRHSYFCLLRKDGFNLVGYLSRELSLGHVARSLAFAAGGARIPVSEISYEQAESPLTGVILRAAPCSSKRPWQW